jgi:hypothetical protein
VEGIGWIGGVRVKILASKIRANKRTRITLRATVE